MSAIPAWKQAILDRKKKAEEEQKKKEDAEAAYLASLPPWKRAMVMKKMPSKSPPSTLERDTKSIKPSSPTTAEPLAPSDKWMAAVQKARESPKSTNRPSWAKNTSTTASSFKTATDNVPSKTQSFTNSKPAPSTTHNNVTSRAKPANSFSSFIPTSPKISSKNAPSSPSIPKIGRRESVTVLPDSTSPAPTRSPVVSTGRVSLRSTEKKPAEHVSDKRRSFEGEDNEDAKLAAMPAWKKALIMRRRAAAAQESKEPKLQPNREPKPQPSKEPEPPKKIIEPLPEEPSNTQKVTPREVVKENPRIEPHVSANKALKGYDETDSPYSTSGVKFSQEDRDASHTPTKLSALKAAKSGSKKQTSRNALEKQGIKHNTSTPTEKPASKKPTKAKSTQLTSKPSSTSTRVKSQPEVINRQTTNSEGPSKLVEQEGVVHRPPVFKEVDEWANVGEDDPAFTKLPLWKQALIKRRRKDIAKRSAPPPPSEPASTKQQPSSTSDARKTTQSIPAWKAELLNRKDQMSREENKRTTPSQTTTDNKNIKNLVNRFGSNQNSGVSSKLQPVRKAPARPAPTRPAPNPPTKQEEPMFTYSFKKSHRTLDAGSESDESDSDLEDVTVTNIDDTSDEDDSGIDKGARGIVVMSYTVTNKDYTPTQSPTHVQPPAVTLTPVNENEPGMKRITSKSILANPAKKSFRGLRRVSFSDSSLTTEHTYPKYTYHDYDDINSDSEDQAQPASENSGLSQRIHPSLRPVNETDSDIYRYSPSKASPLKSSTLGQYTPSIMSSYGDVLQNHLSGSSYGTRTSSPVKTHEPEPEPPMYNGPVNDDRGNDFYSHLSADTAALLW